MAYYVVYDRETGELHSHGVELESARPDNLVVVEVEDGPVAGQVWDTVERRFVVQPGTPGDVQERQGPPGRPPKAKPWEMSS